MLTSEISRFFNGFDILKPLEDTAFTVREWSESAAPFVFRTLSESPALAIGVAVFFLLPAIAAAGVLVRLMTAPQSKNRKPVAEPALPATPYRPLRAILEIARHDARPYTIRHGIVRIGRERDNDICLDHPSVHRYHAIIEQTPDAEFHIAYVGDPDGNRLYIDGRPVTRQQLQGGEVLDIGAVKLRFSLTTAAA